MNKPKRVTRISRIYNTIRGRLYEVELEPNYSFDFSGSQICVCGSISELSDCLNHIVFCDGS